LHPLSFSSFVEIESGNFDLAPLPQAGGYTLTLSAAVTGTVTSSGAGVATNLTRLGQDGYVTLTGTSGQMLNIGIDGAGAPAADVQLQLPNGLLLATAA
jgi:hypothetical protein